MSTTSITLSPEATKAIQALQHPCGTYEYYSKTLSRLFTFILNFSDEIGMSNNEAMDTLRALHALRADIADIAGPPSSTADHIDPFDSITLISGDRDDNPYNIVKGINEEEPDRLTHGASLAAIPEDGIANDNRPAECES